MTIDPVWIAACAGSGVLGGLGGLLLDRRLLRARWKAVRKREAQLFRAAREGRKAERLGRRLAG